MIKTQQITQEAYDERFYFVEGSENSQTCLPYYPSVSFILNELPTPFELKEWYKSKGYHSETIFERAQIVGSYVHNKIEDMIKHGFSISCEDIDKNFSAKESVFIKRCFDGLIKWVDHMNNECESFKIVQSEETLIAGDYAGTTDLIVEANGKTMIVDFKTSRQINDKHEIQVEAYRRAKGCDLGAVLKLGSDKANQKNFKFECAKSTNKQDRLWSQFENAKNLFYIKNPEAQPKVEVFPKEFSIQQ